MANIPVTVPDLGGISEVEVIEVCVQVGDTIAAEEALLVLESDKSTMEVPAPVSGKVESISVSVGDKVSSGTQVAIFEIEQAASAASAEETIPSSPEPSIKKSLEKEAEKPKPNTLSENKECDVIVPDLGGIDSVEVIELSVNVGQHIDAEESLLVLESDKATMEVPMPQSGELLSYKIKVGDKVSPGDVVACFKPDAALESTAESKEPIEKPAALNKPQPSVTTEKNIPPKEIVENNHSKHVHAGPAVRMLSRELGVDLALVNGTGPKGRIIKEDVQNFVKQKLKTASSGAPSVASMQGSQEDFSRYGSISEQPLSKIKQITAKNMLASWTTIPQVTQFDEADITELEHYRKNEMAKQLPEGAKVSPLAFILKACCKALQVYPQFNASLGPNGDSLILKEYYHLAIAVDTPDGLLVPVIKNADQKGIIDLAMESRDLAQKARNKKLPMDAMSGACFTISSLGGIGGVGFTPIVNAPQVAILGVSKAAYKPLWNGSSFEPRLMLPISVSYDHRVIDGAQAAKFTRYLCELLSDVRHLLL